MLERLACGLHWLAGLAIDIDRWWSTREQWAEIRSRRSNKQQLSIINPGDDHGTQRRGRDRTENR
jgi:hypothetical protein